MDEQASYLNIGDPITETDRVLRIVVKANRKGGQNFEPSVSAFSLTDADKADGYRLSCDAESLTTPEHSIARVGC